MHCIIRVHSFVALIENILRGQRWGNRSDGKRRITWQCTAITRMGGLY